MNSIELLSKLDGNQGEKCIHSLKDGTITEPLCFGTTADSCGIMYLKVREGKSEKLMPFVEVKSIKLFE